jgi:hypothetical protein
MAGDMHGAAIPVPIGLQEQFPFSGEGRHRREAGAWFTPNVGMEGAVFQPQPSATAFIAFN